MTYEQIYKQRTVWGSTPNELLLKIIDDLPAGSEFLDLGCGQGRDALYMVRQGFTVTAVDNSKEAIEQIEEYVEANNVSQKKIRLFCEDISTFKIQKNVFTIINAYNSLQFIPKIKSLDVIGRMKRSIQDEGFIIISAFTVKDPLYKKMGNDLRCFFEQDELKTMFSDFRILFYEEGTKEDKGHPGSPLPHTHDIVKMIAQRNSSVKI